MEGDKKEQDRGTIKVYGDVCLRKERRKRQKLLIIELLLDYAKNSTLHGLRYIAEKGVSVFEKVFWLTTFAISFALCFVLIRNVWIKWKTSPVIVSFSEHIVPVGAVPFPSVTICPQIKSKTSVYNFSGEYQKLKDLEERREEGVEPENSTTADYLSRLEKLDDVSLICQQPAYNMALRKRIFANSSIVKNINEVSVPFDDVFWLCVWRNDYSFCRGLFKPVLTDEGLCYNFNSLAADEIFNKNKIQNEYSYLASSTPNKSWSLEYGYTGVDDDPYPRRGRENGASPDLQIFLKESTNERNGLCNSLNRGFKIYVQHPADMPQSSLYYYAALPKQVSSLALKFNMLSTADSLRYYSPDVRKCYFPSDRPLRYFAIYTANNCRLECQSNYTFNRCGCVWFSMPHEDSRHICTVNSLECVIASQDEIATNEIKGAVDPNLDACRCFPDCHSVYYDAEILKTEFDFDTYSKTYAKINDFNFSLPAGVEMSKIEMYFKEPRFVSMRRSELFGLTDFMANCGGLLGLFLGFSFLSLVEVFYFATLRLFYTLRRDLKEEKTNREKDN